MRKTLLRGCYLALFVVSILMTHTSMIIGSVFLVGVNIICVALSVLLGSGLEQEFLGVGATRLSDI